MKDFLEKDVIRKLIIKFYYYIMIEVMNLEYFKIEEEMEELNLFF